MQLLRFSLGNSLRFYSTNPKTKLKFFSKSNCQLCNEADSVLTKSLNQLAPIMKDNIAPIEYIDITKPENKEWFECYRYDIPVLWIEREDYKKVVFMHRFDQDELTDELNQDM